MSEQILWGQDSIFGSSRRAALLALSASLVGGISVFLVGPLTGTGWLVFLYAMLLTIPVAVAKTSTACGINALGTFSQRAIPLRLRLRDAALYLLTSTGTGALIGAALGHLGSLAAGSSLLLPTAGLIGLIGFRELGFLLCIPVPTRRWQVPAGWVADRRRAPFIWGVFLGSGLSTWMPHPSFFGLLVISALLPFPTGVILMASYGFNRALPGLMAAVSARCSDRVALSASWRLRLLGHTSSGATSIALATALGISSLGNWTDPTTWSLAQASELVGGQPVAALVALVTAVILGLSGLAKFTSPRKFAEILTATYGLPTRSAQVSAVIVPITELGAAALLLSPVSRTLGLGLSALLIGTFLAAVAVALVRGGSGDCGCLGIPGQQTLGPRTLIRSAALLTFVVIGLGSTALGHSGAMTSTLPPSLGVFAAMASGVAATTLAAALARLVRADSARRL
jgi:uncharacterized membrane protein